MPTFYHCTNNGVTGVVTEETCEDIKRYRSFPREAQKHIPYPGPIFTFVETRDFEHDTFRTWVTGDYALMDRLVRGSLFLRAEFDVPFSNSKQLNGDKAEMARKTTLEEALTAFPNLTLKK